MPSIRFEVNGMSGDHSKQAVARALTDLNGVQGVDVNLTTGHVLVQYDEGKVGRTAMVGAITDAGYIVKP